MNNNIDKKRIIDADELDRLNYFQSLLEQAYTKGLLTDSDMERLQFETLTLLSKKVERYNAGDSSSIATEKAQSLMTSNLYTISLWLKTYPNPDDAVTAMQRESIQELYQKGYDLIETMVKKAKLLHKFLTERIIEIENEFYRATAIDGIAGFFKLYEPEFAAHETHITADYPVFCRPDFTGIEFISAYLKNLYCENSFCRKFPIDNIHRLLCGLSVAANESYREMYFNIYEQVLLAAIGCTIAASAEASPLNLDITANGLARLNTLFFPMNKSEVLLTLQKSAAELAAQLHLPDELIQYVQDSLPETATRIESAARHGESAFILPVYPNDASDVIYL